MDIKTLCMLALVALGANASGCAILTASKTVDYAVNSTPPGAEVRMNGVPVGVTPTTVQLGRKDTQLVEVVAQGYKPVSCRPIMGPGTFYVVSDALICAATLVVIVPVGCLSFLDAMGAWNEPKTNQCNVTLEADYASPAPPPPPPPTYGPPPRS